MRTLLVPKGRNDVAMPHHYPQFAASQLEIQMDLRDLRAFSPPRTAWGRGGRVRGSALKW